MTTKLPTALLEPCWGNRRIDRRAWSVIERCRKRQASERPPLPIPVEDWIEGPLGIQLGFADLSYLGDNVLGAAFVKSREILIDEQVLSHEGRCRFTCAHELGHLTLHSNLRNEFHDSQVDVTFSLETIERQADRFAAAFLMPLPLLERELVGVLDKTGLKRTECIYELMQSSPESEWLWRYRVLPMITERKRAIGFEPTTSSLGIRCSARK
jgi:hypothetical protein